MFGNYQNSLEMDSVNGLEKHYSFLLILERGRFEMKYKTSSHWYRILSNSNQVTSYKTNRKYWNDTFVGGQYRTIICDNEIILQFNLELRNVNKHISELDLRFRIGKATKGVGYKLILNDSLEIEKIISECENCQSLNRKIGKWYK